MVLEMDNSFFSAVGIEKMLAEFFRRRLGIALEASVQDMRTVSYSGSNVKLSVNVQFSALQMLHSSF